ncbi:MAG: hypothetical protein JSS53_05300 [Proteobacteria bacterium]|nr:hypothetical protein [Pseudomonadota bacterium]
MYSRLSFIKKLFSWKKHKEIFRIFKNLLVELYRKQKNYFSKRWKQYQKSREAQKFIKTIPTYLIFGPKKSGKSHLLTQSGLEFSNQENPVKELFLELNIHPWVSEKSIWLEVTLNDDKNTCWNSFIKTMKKIKPNSPLNGVFIAIPMSQFFLEETISKTMENLSAFLKLCIQSFGYLIPIKLIVTHGDQFFGFLDFFSGGSDEELCQLFGVQDTDGYSDIIKVSDDLKNLVNKIRDMRIYQLSRVLPWTEKINIHLFPEDFYDLCEKIIASLKPVFASVQKAVGINWCGIYFTAKSQDKNLFMKKIFCDDLLLKNQFIQRTAKKKTKRHVLCWFSSVFAASIIIAAFFSLRASYINNIDLMRQSSQWLIKLREDIHNPSLISRRSFHDLLESWRFFETLKGYQKEKPWLLGLGLYRGNHTIPKFEKLFSEILNKQFLPEVELSLYKQLKTFSDEETLSESNRITYYQTLKSYLMLWFPHRIDADYLSPQLSQWWIQKILNRLPEDFLFPGLTRLIHFYLNENQTRSTKNSVSVLDLDWKTIEHARAQLKTSNPIEHAYQEFIAEKSARWPSLSLSELIRDPDHLLQSAEHLPGIYTADAWKTDILPSMQKKIRHISGEDWVMEMPLSELLKPLRQDTNNNSINFESTLKKFKEIYFSNYIKSWMTLLNSITMPSFQSFSETEKILNQLLDPESPLQQYFSIMNLNLQIIFSEPIKSNINDSKLSSLKKLLAFNTNQLKEGFVPEYFSFLKKIELEIEELNHSVNLENSAEHYATSLLTENKPNLALYQANLWVNQWVGIASDEEIQKPFRKFLQEPLKHVWRVVLDQCIKSIENDWISQVKNNYQAELENKLPLVHEGSNADISSIFKFFNPTTGIVSSFFKSRISPFIYLVGAEFSKKSWLDEGLILSDSLLNDLKNMMSIGNLFYRNDQNTLSLNFEIYPLPSPLYSEIELTLNSEVFKYHNGPQEWVPFHWSAQMNGASAVLHVVFSKQNGEVTLEYLQPLAWFQLLSAAQIAREKEGQYRLTWMLNDNSGKKYPLSLLMRVSETQDFIRILGWMKND